MSLWNEQLEFAKPSFEEPVPDPGTDPTAGPLVCVQFNHEWLQYVCGCLLQLCQPPSWAITDPTALGAALVNATKLLNLFASAELCVPTENGIITLTILAGEGSVSQPIVFANTYAAPPVVVVSSNSEGIYASWSAVTTTGFTLTLACATPTPVDISCVGSWDVN